MPPALLAALPAITAAGSAVAGVASGGKGSDDRVTSNSGSTVSRTEFAPASQQEADLQKKSLENYMAQQGMLGQQEQSLQSTYDPLRQQAATAAGDVLSGQAFNLSPEEQMRIDNTRQALIQAGQGDIQKYLDENLGGIQASAGNRNLRGQAVTSLQGKALETSADQYGNLVAQANLTAAQQAQSQPLARIGAQQGQIQQGLTLGEMLRQNAIQNRTTAQSPALLDLLRNERMAGGTRTNMQADLSRIPGAQGSVGNALVGGIAGGLGGFKAGTDIANLAAAKTGNSLIDIGSAGMRNDAASMANFINAGQSNSGGSAMDTANFLRGAESA